MRTPETRAEFLERCRAVAIEQGLPPTLEDPMIIAAVVAVLRVKQKDEYEEEEQP